MFSHPLILWRRPKRRLGFAHRSSPSEVVVDTYTFLLDEVIMPTLIRIKNVTRSDPLVGWHYKAEMSSCRKQSPIVQKTVPGAK
jgi:hypothetical protein